MSGDWCIDYVPSAPADPQLRRVFAKVWSQDPSHTWVVGEELPSGGVIPVADGTTHALILSWDGCAWTRAALPAASGLLGVWGANAHDVWAVGRQGTALHWDGSSWSSVDVGTKTDLRGISGTSGTDVWIIKGSAAASAIAFPGGDGLLHWDGTRWTASAPIAGVGDIWASAPNSVWATTGDANVAHFDGATWTTMQAAPFSNFALFAIWADATTAWTVGEGLQASHLTQGTWQNVQPPSGSAQGFVDVMASGTDVYAVGQGVQHATGNGPFAFDPDAPAPPAAFYRGVWMTPSQVWVVGQISEAFVMHRTRGGTAGAGQAGTGGNGGGTAGAGQAGTGGGGAGGTTGSVAGSDCTAPNASTCSTGLLCERLAPPECVDPNWAEWPMPNGPLDVALLPGGCAVCPPMASGAPNPPNIETYTDNRDGTVTDTVTGLMWQQAVTNGTFTQAMAVGICQTLTLGGHGDWRLPTRIELVSIVDVGQSNPAINATYFPGTPAAPFWTSSIQAGNTSLRPVGSPTEAWLVDFQYGHAVSGDLPEMFFVRCMR